MGNIKFIGRAEEIEKIRSIKGNFFLVVKGRRRIGKTMLLRKALPDAVYIFVWPDKSMDWICNEICEENKMPSLNNIKDIIDYLLDKEKVIIIDEFQNFFNIDKSVYGEMQKIIDERKLGKKFCKIAVAGSSYSLMNRVFNDYASPLYGRRTHEITLENLKVKDLCSELKLPFEELMKLWSVFEGVPYYYELVSKDISAEENIKNLVISKNSQLKEEGKAVISVEFGKDSKTYTTILSAISEGKTKLNEISGLFGNKKNEVVKYLDILRKDFSMVRKITPITEDPKKSREGRYEIIDNFLSFWFLFVDKERSLIEQERFGEVEEKFKNSFNSYLGRKFEKLMIYLFSQGLMGSLGSFNDVGRQWGKFNGELGKNSYEIDLVATNKKTKEILFGECKWSDDVDAEIVLKDLRDKSVFVRWNDGKRNETFAVFAKSFKKKINNFDGKKAYCLDLADIKDLLRLTK